MKITDLKDVSLSGNKASMTIRDVPVEVQKWLGEQLQKQLKAIDGATDYKFDAVLTVEMTGVFAQEVEYDFEDDTKASAIKLVIDKTSSNLEIK